MTSALPPPGAPDFDVWLSDHEDALQRTAHLLTGNAHAAQDLVQNTLARLYRRWDRIRDVPDLDAHARRTLVNEFRTAWRRPGRRAEPLVEVVPERPAPGSRSYDESREAVWSFVSSLPPKQRAVVVLRFHDRLTDAEIADLMGISPGTVSSQSSRAVASLRASTADDSAFTEVDPATGRERPRSAEDLLTRTLRDIVETTDYPTTSTSTVAARSRTLARARRRTTALVAGAAAVVVVAGSGVALLDHHQATKGSPTGALSAASLRDLAQGQPPRVAFLEGNAFVAANGETVTAPVFRTATTAATIGDGVLVAGPTTTQRPFATISLVAGGSTRRLGCGTPAFALGSGDPAYWLSDGCRFLGPGRLFHGTTTTPTAKGVIYSPVGSTSSGVVAVGTLVLRKGAGSSGPVLITPGGSIRPLPRAAAVTAVSPSGVLVVGTGSLGKGVVSELTTGAVQWRTQQSTLGHFSASGRYVVAVRSFGAQGAGDAVGIRDAATGHQVTSTILPHLSIVGRPVWEGDSSVLVVADDRNGQQAIVRVGLDGSVTRATPVAPQGHGTYRLAATP